MKNFIVASLMVLSFASQASAQSNTCERAWRDACRQDVMDRVAEKMKTLWNEEFTSETWKRDWGNRYKINSVQINKFTVQIQYRYVNSPRLREYADTNGLVTLVYNISDKDDKITGVPLLGSPQPDPSYNKDFEALLKTPYFPGFSSDGSYNQVYGELPSKYFVLALRSVILGQGPFDQGEGKQIIAANPSYFVIKGAKINGETVYYKITKDGVLMDKFSTSQPSFFTKPGSFYTLGSKLTSYTYSGVGGFELGLIGFDREEPVTYTKFAEYDANWSPDLPIDDRYYKAELLQEVTLANLRDGDRLGTSGLNGHLIGDLPDGQSIVIRSIYGITSGQGGCQGGRCAGIVSGYWSSVSFFDRKVIAVNQVDLPTSSRVQLITAADQDEVQFTFERDDKPEVIDDNIFTFRSLGLDGSEFVIIDTVADNKTRFAYTVGNYKNRANIPSYFLVKMDFNGNIAWTKSFSKAQGQSIRSSAIDTKGNVVLVGEAIESSGFGTQSLAVLVSPSQVVLGEKQWGLEGAEERFNSVLYDAATDSFVVTGKNGEVDPVFGEPVPDSSTVSFVRFRAVDLSK